MSKIFISYRRKSSAFTLLLANKLSQQLDAEIFVDFDSIDRVDFETSILTHLRESDVFLLMVTEHTFADRIHMETDWVRKEIRTALERDIPIVLVSENGMYPPANLPEDIREIRNKQGIEFYPAYFDAAVARLVKFLVKATNVRLKVASPTPAPDDSQALPVPKAQIEEVVVDQEEVTSANGRKILTDALTAFDAGDYAQALFLFEALQDIDYQTRVVDITETMAKVRELHEREENKRHAAYDYDEIALFASNQMTLGQALQVFKKWAEDNADFVDELDTKNLRDKLREQQQAEKEQERQRKADEQAAKQKQAEPPQQQSERPASSASKPQPQTRAPVSPSSTAKSSSNPLLLIVGAIAVLIIGGIVIVNLMGGNTTIALTPVTRNADWQPFSTTFDDDPTNTEMMLVPVGSFTMGSSDPNADSDENPHPQEITEPYWIDKYEVTNADFARFLNAEGNRSTDGFEYLDDDDSDARIDNNGGTWQAQTQYADHPVTEVTWFGAHDYCSWRGGQLPTETQWEFAASGVDDLEYPWGDDWNPDNAVWSGNNPDDTLTDVIGSKPNGVSWVGAEDMSGNVWEWVSSLYAEYPYNADHESDTNSSSVRVLRGGSWVNDSTASFRAANRDLWNPDDSLNHLGFRCARSYN